MPIETKDVVVPSGGDVYQAPVGTALPADLITPIAPWVNIGFLSDENPPAVTGMQREATDLFAWNVDTALRSALAPAAPVLTMELLQLESALSMQLYFGGGTQTGTTTLSYDAPSIATPVEAATLIDVIDSGRKIRMIFPRTVTRANGDITLGRGAFVTMPLAMSVLAPSTGTWLRVLTAPNAALATEGVTPNTLPFPDEGTEGEVPEGEVPEGETEAVETDVARSGRARGAAR